MEASAFVPGHVTGFFSAHTHDDPARAGSRGGGLTLTEGVRVTVGSGDGFLLDGQPVSVDSVDRVLAALGVDAHVSATTDLPLGAGFGVSGALALGTALATNAAFDCACSMDSLATVAHVADVEAGTGLGDVVSQLRGGVPLRLDPGAPPHGRVDAIPARSRVEYLSFGERSTEDVLAGDVTKLSAAGDRALEKVRAEPTLTEFVRVSRQFARESDLLTPDLQTIIEDVDMAGGEAAMAMLGETVFALDTGLSDAGYTPEVTEIHPGGATLCRPYDDSG